MAATRQENPPSSHCLVAPCHPPSYGASPLKRKENKKRKRQVYTNLCTCTYRNISIDNPADKTVPSSLFQPWTLFLQEGSPPVPSDPFTGDDSLCNSGLPRGTWGSFSMDMDSFFEQSVQPQLPHPRKGTWPLSPQHQQRRIQRGLMVEDQVPDLYPP